ncbi:Iduronate 2-sulfatase [Nymphon striatum]|nr:Iduronate 2-sulfatase [Nymphon striatum]
MSLEVAITSDVSGTLWNCCVWNIDTGTTLMTYKGGISGNKTLNMINKNYLISALKDKQVINIWNLNQRELHQKLICPGRITAMAVSPDGLYCAVAVDEKIHIWQMSSGYLLTSIIGYHHQCVTCLKFTSDGSMLISGGEDCLVLAWSMNDTDDLLSMVKPLYSWSQHSLPVTDIFVGIGSSTHARVATVSLDQTLKIFDLGTGQLLLCIVFNDDLYSVSMDPCEYYVFVGSGSGRIFKFDLFNPPRAVEHHFKEKENNTFKGHGKCVKCLSVSMDGNRLLSGSDDSSVRLWDVKSFNCIKVFPHKGPITNALLTLIPNHILTTKLKIMNNSAIPIKSFKQHLHSIERDEGNIDINLKSLPEDLSHYPLTSDEIPTSNIFNMKEDPDKMKALEDENRKLKDTNKQHNLKDEHARPNILLVIVDDLRASLGCYGSSVITPNIDNLADHGIVFNHAYAQQAICGPSRTSFLTSRRPDTTEIISNKRGWHRQSGKNFTTLPQYFKENGYHTASIGKVFHPGGIHRKTNKTDDYPASWSDVPYHPSTQIYKEAKVCLSKDGSRYMNLICPVDIEEQPEKTLPDIQSADYAVNFLKNYSKSKPFFLAVGFHKPHIPLKYPKKYLDLYPLSSIPVAPGSKRSHLLPSIAWNPWTDIRLRDDVKSWNVSFPYGPIQDYNQRLIRQSYFAATSYMDDQVGKVLAQLEQSDFSENTVVIFLADHGWSLGEHGEWSKFSNFEVSVRVPLIVYDPHTMNKNSVSRNFQHIKPSLRSQKKFSSKQNGRYSNALVELVDIFPTLADITGLQVPHLCPEKHSKDVLLCTEGFSFFPLLELNERHRQIEWKRAVFSQYPRPSILPQENSDQPLPVDVHYMGYSIRTKRFRYTEWVSYDSKLFKANWNEVVSRELYDHGVDPLEDENRISEPLYGKYIKKLSKLLRKGWRSSLPFDLCRKTV